MFGRMNKMAAWEFFLQDGGLSESLTHKMAAFMSFTHKMVPS